MLSGAQICSTSLFLKFKSAYIGYTYLHAVKTEAENLNKKKARKWDVKAYKVSG